MRNQEFGKLMYFLTALDVAERALFRDYLHSPVFNLKEEPRLLYDYILLECLQETPKDIDDAVAVNAVWPAANGDLARLQKEKSRLMKLFTAFLEFQHWQSAPAWSKVGLLHRLNEIGDESYFAHYYRKVKRELANFKHQDLERYAAELDLEMAMMRHQLSHGLRSRDTHLEEARSAMEKMVHGQVLKFAFLIANQRLIVGAEMPPWILAHLTNLDYDALEGEPLLEIYFLLYATLDAQATLTQLQHLKDKLLLHAPHCQMYVAHNLYTGTLNNYWRYSQRTGQNLLGSIFELYQSMVENLHRKGGEPIDRSHFKNIVLVGVRVGEFDWVAQFIGEASAWLDDDDPEMALAFNMGVLHFYKKDFADAARFFNRALVDVKDVFYAYDARFYLLMCHYETGDSIGMESLVHSFRMLLDRSARISEQHKNKYLAFTRLFRKLLGIPPNDQIRLQQLKAEIDQLNVLVGKSWLLEKVEAILR